MNAHPRGIPLRPSPESLNQLALDSVVRSCIAVGNQKFNNVPPREFVQKRWGAEAVRDFELLQRAATTPASTLQAGWAAELATISTALLSALTPISAGANLLQRGLPIDFGRDAGIRLPTIAPGLAGFVRQGAPIPVERFAAAGPLMEPRKMAVITEMTREMMQSASAENLVRAALVESVGKGLDLILFDDQPGDDVRPPGLRYGVAALPAAGPSEKVQAMADDLVALGAAVGAVAGGPLTYIAAVPQALGVGFRSLNTFSGAILPSASLPSGMVIAVADAALAASIDGPPEIDASRQAELQRETNPAPIASGGTMVTPVASVFQLDSIALRLRWPLSWCLRGPAIAWMQSVNW